MQDKKFWLYKFCVKALIILHAECHFNLACIIHLFCFISNAVIFNPSSFFKIYGSLLNCCLFFCQKSRPRCLFKSTLPRININTTQLSLHILHKFLHTFHKLNETIVISRRLLKRKLRR